MTLGSHIPGIPRTCVTRFRTRLVWLCSDGNYFCNKAHCHAVTMVIVLCLIYACVGSHSQRTWNVYQYRTTTTTHTAKVRSSKQCIAQQFIMIYRTCRLAITHRTLICWILSSVCFSLLHVLLITTHWSPCNWCSYIVVIGRFNYNVHFFN